MRENKKKTNEARNIRAREIALTKLTDHALTSEKELEKYLCRRVKEVGLICLKYSNANEAGYPDRVVLTPCDTVVWIELKSRGRRPTPLQRRRHEQLEALGHIVWVIDRREQIDNLLNAFVRHEV